eukprot:CAMPEP_0203647426 /NCGR_PEP_ID=MMETSP0088-20131115/15759_1 /ASSEMBLY_ACC=CAM_ASM_001087 /TAXON_ID=426623 /ORGANISM="Chaetoceros affinis, Strain CCMP159" /LENGTH=296 /DNA_ID=CAMNT_0050505059 /DNA_START=81 /DNA_END=971 /DNA_ORIENTATION=-
MKLFQSISVTLIASIGIALQVLQSADAFIFSRNEPYPNLIDMAQAQTGTLFNVRLQIANPTSLSQLYIDGLQLELDCVAPPKGKDHVMLPGANGEQPELSTGPLGLKANGGSFISSGGLQKVRFEQEAWEMVWLADRPTGSIICGFHVPQPYIRNDAILPPGQCFLNFRVWTPKGLHTARNEKMAYERSLAKHVEAQKDAIDKMNATSNPIMKAVHFRNAAAANEMISVTHTNRFQTVPMEDDDVVTIGDGLLVAKQGTIWTTVYEDKPFNLGKKETHFYLGGAMLKDLVKDDVKE